MTEARNAEASLGEVERRFGSDSSGEEACSLSNTHTKGGAFAIASETTELDDEQARDRRCRKSR
jgi:hypothetical protein